MTDNQRQLPNQDLDAVSAGGPRDVVVVALGNHLTAVDLASDGGAREVAILGGSGTRAGLPSCTAVGNNVDSAEELVAEVAVRPGLRVGEGWSKGGKELSLGGTRDRGGGVNEIEDQLALIRFVLVVELEGHQRGDVGATVGGAPRNEAAGGVEVDRAGGAVVLRRKVGEYDSNRS